jgi:hypothetical protein
MFNYETSFTDMWHIIFVILDLSTPAIGTGIQNKIKSAIGMLVWMWNGVQGPLLLGKSCLRKVHPQSQRLFAEV